jgi:Na+-transporting methylmalonyl-CoA/oxaloacetate decarboxylase gamma subunit
MSPSGFVRCSECRALNEPRALFCSRCGASLYGGTSGKRRRRRVTAAGVAMSVAFLLLLAATVFALYTVVQRALEPEVVVNPYAGQSGTTATLSSATTEASTGSTVRTTTTLTGTLIRPTSVDSSSALKATSSNNYRATNLLDGDLATAWEEGAEGPGLGEWVTFEFSRQLVLARIEVANGYQKDEERFLGNPRIKSLEVAYSNGTTQLINLLDADGYQSITPTRQPVEWFKMTIVSVYPGEVWEDTALSEVRVLARPD